jgi:hypothetical protein
MGIIDNLEDIEDILFFISLFLLIMTTNIGTLERSTSAQPSQVWIDRENNMRILFTYTPENPVISTPTELKFSVDDLRTGTHLKNLLARVVIISNSSGQEKIFKIKDIPVPNGNFSMEYLFPELGVYQVITRINSSNPSSVTLSSFEVIVKLETSLLNIGLGITILVIFASAAYLVVVVKGKKGRKNL